MNIIWTNSTNSGLGDRLIDISLMSAYAKVLKSDLYFDWKIFTNGGVHEWNFNQSEKKKWEDIRFVDYLYENFSRYFSLPKNIHVNKFVDNRLNISRMDCIFFNDSLGGVNSPHLFHQKYLLDKISIDDFLIIFNDTLREFQPTDLLLNIVGDLKPDIALHLRRQDKVRLESCSVTLRPDQIDDLNERTSNLVNELTSGDKVLYIASDDISEKNNYLNRYNGYSVDNFKINELYEKTYVDIYMMSRCDVIILSQKHSSFSLFASLIGGCKLIYLYEDCQINKVNFNKLDNIIYYKNYKINQ